MTYNELKRFYKGYRFRTGEEDWLIVKKTKGNCFVECNADDYDEEVYFDVVCEDKGE
jgi:hypothetical protein